MQQNLHGINMTWQGAQQIFVNRNAWQRIVAQYAFNQGLRITSDMLVLLKCTLIRENII